MRAVIAEDNVLLAEGLALLLSRAGCEVVELVTDGDRFVEAAVRHRPEISIVDVRMPPLFRDEGVQAALAARKLVPGLPILVLSQYVETAYAAQLLADAAGGVGYLLKDRVGRVEEFIDAVRRVARGATVVDPEVVSQLLTRPRTDPVGTLTARELEVLRMMAEGVDNATIGARLHLTDSAVQKHIGNMFAKLGLPPDIGGNRRVRAVLAYLNRQPRV